MLRFLLTTNQTCVATNQVVADCDKVLQKVESSSTFRNEICTYCAFYRSEANLFCNKWRYSRVYYGVTPTQFYPIRGEYSRNLQKHDLLQNSFERGC